MQITPPTLTAHPINDGGSPETSPLLEFEPFNFLPAERPSNLSSLDLYLTNDALVAS
jgi:hypothetical protein